MTEYSSNQPIGKEWTEKERKGTQNANVHRNMLPRASQRGVPFDRGTRLWAIRSSHQHGGAGRRAAAPTTPTGEKHATW